MIWEVLKLFEVQGFIKVMMGLLGGGMVVEVLFDCMFQLLQNYLFFKDVMIDDIYMVCKLFEFELVVGVVLYLMECDFVVLEVNIVCCDGVLGVYDCGYMLCQWQEDMMFYDIFVVVNLNLFLCFSCELINEMIWQLIEFWNDMLFVEYKCFGEVNVLIYKVILQVVCEWDVECVWVLMVEYMIEVFKYVKWMKGKLCGWLIFDFEICWWVVVVLVVGFDVVEVDVEEC